MNIAKNVLFNNKLQVGTHVAKWNLYEYKNVLDSLNVWYFNLDGNEIIVELAHSHN